jgi:hypothetical protein
VTFIVIAMIIVLGVAVGVMGMVVIGMQGGEQDGTSKLVNAVSRAVQHLNGDGQPPTRLVKHLR